MTSGAVVAVAATRRHALALIAVLNEARRSGAGLAAVVAASRHLGTPHDHSPSVYAAEMDAMLHSADVGGPYVLRQRRTAVA